MKHFHQILILPPLSENRVAAEAVLISVHTDDVVPADIYCTVSKNGYAAHF